MQLERGLQISFAVCLSPTQARTCGFGQFWAQSSEGKPPWPRGREVGEGIVPAAARSSRGSKMGRGSQDGEKQGGEGLAVAPGAAGRAPEPQNVLGVKATGRILAGTPRCWPRCSR